jgi:hypothetical protein
MDYKRYQYRFSLLFTSMLTSVTFRFSIHGRVLPTISYLTFLDMYCVSSILVVFTCMICHGIYCVLHTKNEDIAVRFDAYSMYFIGIIVFLMHLVQIIWFSVAFRKRQRLSKLDRSAIIDNNTHLKTLKPLVNKELSLKKTYYSIAKLQDSSLVLFKEYLKPRNDHNDQVTWSQHNDQNTLTTPTAMNVFNQRFRIPMSHGLNGTWTMFFFANLVWEELNTRITIDGFEMDDFSKISLEVYYYDFIISKSLTRLCSFAHWNECHCWSKMTPKY